MSATIESYALHRLRIPLTRTIGDSQVRFDVHWMTLLELRLTDGTVGVGAELQQGQPTAALEQQEERFQMTHWPTLQGQQPLQVALQIGRPRGGNVGAAPMPLAVETAAWDLAAKQQQLPLYQLLGGSQDRVPAYGSTLDFHLSDEDFVERLTEFRQLGLNAVKIKVGHPDIDWDLRRLSLAEQVFGPDADLMIDSNEAWSPKEAIVRANIFREAGFDIYWIEDPISRRDYAGYQTLCQQLPFTRINTGEYLGVTGKRKLLEASAVDVINVHGNIAASRFAAQLAGDYGIPIALGNTIFEIGIHLAASLPECLYMEFSDLAWNQLARQPVVIEDGYALLPDRPGHGIEIDEDALAEFAA